MNRADDNGETDISFFLSFRKQIRQTGIFQLEAPAMAAEYF